jgi:hypothetical protein
VPQQTIFVPQRLSPIPQLVVIAKNCAVESYLTFLLADALRSLAVAHTPSSLVPKWQMAGTKHLSPVSETTYCFPSYLHGRGTLLGIDLCAPSTTQKVPGP